MKLRVTTLLLLLLTAVTGLPADGPPSWYSSIWKNTNNLADWRAKFTNTIDLAQAPYNIVGDGVTDYTPIVEKALTNSINGSILQFPATTGTNRIVFKSNLIIGSFKNANQDKAVILRGHPSGTWIESQAPTASLANAITIRGGSESGTTAITAGATAGSTSVTVASAAGISIGSYIWIKQASDLAQLPPDTTGGSGDTTNTQGVMAQVTNVVGNVISFNVPLIEALNNSPTLQVCFPRDFVGIENLKITMTNQATDAQLISMFRSAQCWVSGCTLTNFYQMGIAVQRTFGSIVQSNTVGWASRNASTVYAIDVADYSTGIRVEDNIVGNASSGIVLQQGAKHCAILYNYAPSTYPASFYPPNFMSGAVNMHGANDHWNLIEGNIGCAYLSDDVWGINRMNTVFRNWWTSHDPSLSWPGETSNSVKAIEVMFTNRLNWVAQNVTGLSQDNGTSWPKGYPSASKILNGAANDTLSTNSVNLRFVNNYSFVDGVTTSWNGDTYVTPPASLFYTGKPAYFSSGMAWPLIGPDVASKTNYNPAVYRYLGLSMPGAGTATYYVATDGLAGNTGTSIASPWNLAKAFSYVGYNNGDTVLIRGGVHSGNLTDGRTNAFVFSAQSTGLVTWKPYRNERAIIDACRVQITGYSGQHTFQNLEFTTLKKPNHLTDTSERWQFWEGSAALGDFKFVNNIAYNVPQLWGGVTKDLRGNFAVNVGATSFEHGLYGGGGTSANILNNVLHTTSGYGINWAPAVYSSGVNIRSNIVINPGLLSSPAGQEYGVLLQGGPNGNTNMLFADNIVAVNPNLASTTSDNPLVQALYIGAGPVNSGYVISNNVVSGNDITVLKVGALSSSTASGLVIKNNQLIINNGGTPVSRSILYIPGTQSGMASDFNSFINLGAATARFQYPDGVGYTTLPSWRTGTSLDASSTLTKPSTYTISKVFKSDDQVGRAHIVVLNQSAATTATVDISGVGLVDGQQYVLMYAQSVNTPSTWVTNTYAALAPTVTIPLTATAWPMTTPLSFADYTTPPHALPYAGVWLLMPCPIAPTLLGVTTPDAVSYGLAWSDSGGATENTGWIVRKSIFGGPFTTIATLPYTTLTFTDTPVSQTAMTTYAVSAYNGYGESAMSTMTLNNFIPPPPVTPPPVTTPSTSTPGGGASTATINCTSPLSLTKP